MRNRILAFAALAAAFSGAACGADCSGIWTGQMTDRNGDLQDLSFRLNQRGDTLEGKMYGDNESTPLREGAISGNRITFTVTSELNGQVTTFVYTGTIEGDQMELTRVRAGATEPAAKGAGTRAQERQPVRLRRVA